MTLFTGFGGYVDGLNNWSSGSGFEEWAFDTGRVEYSVAVPEPNTVACVLISSLVFLPRSRRLRRTRTQ